MQQSLQLRSRLLSNKTKFSDIICFPEYFQKISPLIDKCPIFRSHIDQGAYPVFRADINGYKSGTVFSDNGNVPS